MPPNSPYPIKKQIPRRPLRLALTGRVVQDLGQKLHTSRRNGAVHGPCSPWQLATGNWQLPFARSGLRPSLVRGTPPQRPLTPLLAQHVGSFVARCSGDPSRRHRACTIATCRQSRRGQCGRLCASPAPPFEFRRLVFRVPSFGNSSHRRHDFPPDDSLPKNGLHS